MLNALNLESFITEAENKGMPVSSAYIFIQGINKLDDAHCSGQGNVLRALFQFADDATTHAMDSRYIQQWIVF